MGWVCNTSTQNYATRWPGQIWLDNPKRYEFSSELCYGKKRASWNVFEMFHLADSSSDLLFSSYSQIFQVQILSNFPCILSSVLESSDCSESVLKTRKVTPRMYSTESQVPKTDWELFLAQIAQEGSSLGHQTCQERTIACRPAGPLPRVSGRRVKHRDHSLGDYAFLTTLALLARGHFKTELLKTDKLHLKPRFPASLQQSINQSIKRKKELAALGLHSNNRLDFNNH